MDTTNAFWFGVMVGVIATLGIGSAISLAIEFL